MKLSINLFDLNKFENLRDENEYLQKTTSYANNMWFIDVNDTKDIEWLLKKNRIRYKIKI